MSSCSECNSCLGIRRLTCCQSRLCLRCLERLENCTACGVEITADYEEISSQASSTFDTRSTLDTFSMWGDTSDGIPEDILALRRERFGLNQLQLSNIGSSDSGCYSLDVVVNGRTLQKYKSACLRTEPGDVDFVVSTPGTIFEVKVMSASLEPAVFELHVDSKAVFLDPKRSQMHNILEEAQTPEDTRLQASGFRALNTGSKFIKGFEKSSKREPIGNGEVEATTDGKHFLFDLPEESDLTTTELGVIRATVFVGVQKSTRRGCAYSQQSVDPNLRGHAKKGLVGPNHLTTNEAHAYQTTRKLRVQDTCLVKGAHITTLLLYYRNSSVLEALGINEQSVAHNPSSFSLGGSPALCQSPHPPPLEVPRSFGPPGARNNFTVISPPPRPALSTRDAAHAAAVARALSTSASSGMNGAFPGRRVEPPWTPQRLPYDGSLPAAQAAQDRHAIRFLMEVQMPSCQNQEGSSNAGRLQEKAAASPLRVRVSASLSVPLSSRDFVDTSTFEHVSSGRATVFNPSQASAASSSNCGLQAHGPTSVHTEQVLRGSNTIEGGLLEGEDLALQEALLASCHDNYQQNLEGVLLTPSPDREVDSDATATRMSAAEAHNTARSSIGSADPHSVAAALCAGNENVLRLGRVSSSACTRDPEQWTRFQNVNGKLWWWCAASHDFFFEQDSGPWKKFCDSVSKRLWWWNEQTGGYFFEDSESG